eukprot:302578-Amphidinium_carterae.2
MVQDCLMSGGRSAACACCTHEFGAAQGWVGDTICCQSFGNERYGNKLERQNFGFMNGFGSFGTRPERVSVFCSAGHWAKSPTRPAKDGSAGGLGPHICYALPSCRNSVVLARPTPASWSLRPCIAKNPRTINKIGALLDQLAPCLRPPVTTRKLVHVTQLDDAVTRH